MSIVLDKSAAAAAAECASLGVHPRRDPLGDGHHTDVPFTDRDKEIGAAVAWFLGTLFADVEAPNSRYWHFERTSVDEWCRVVRALRVHGMKIVDDPEPAQ